MPAVLLATARASAFHSSVLYGHSTLVLSLLAINCRSLELIVEQIVVFPLSASNSMDSWLSAILVIVRLIVFGRIFIVLTVRVCINRLFHWRPFSWNLDVCCCVAYVLLVCSVLSDASLIDLVLCSFVFELLYRGQWCKLNTWPEVGLFVHLRSECGFVYQVRAVPSFRPIAVYVLFVNWCSTNQVCF